MALKWNFFSTNLSYLDLNFSFFVILKKKENCLGQEKWRALLFAESIYILSKLEGTMIEVFGVSKSFGKRQVLKDISFTIQKGQIVGFLGPNGAGKTTTMRILTGFFPPDKGTIKVAGHDMFTNPIEVKKRLGYLPEHNPLYLEMTVEGYLRFVARIKGVNGKRETQRIQEVMASCGLEGVRNRLIKRLSKGYKQRVGLAQALVNDPEILILDEPTVGLDPKQITEIRQLIKNLAAQKTVILSTHILPEVNMVCNRVIIINKGEVVAEDTPENLTSQKGQVEILLKAPSKAEIKRGLESISGVKDLKISQEGEFYRLLISFSPHDDLRPVLVEEVVKHGWKLYEISSRRLSLEEVFVQLVTEEAS